MAARTPTADEPLEVDASSNAVDLAAAERCAAGDADAIAKLYTVHAASVRAMTRLHAGESAADDLLHDTFVRALELTPRYRGDAPLGVWLRGIAFNLARTQRRRAARRAKLLRRNAPMPGPSVAPDERTALQTLDVLAARLPDVEREAFFLRGVQRLSLDEVATLLGVAVSTVSDRDRRARTKLRAWMKEEG